MKLTAKPVFSCIPCQYTCYKKSDLSKHIKTAKHRQLVCSDKAAETFICSNCGCQYASKSGLWKHRKKCIEKNTTSTSRELDDIHNELKKQNDDLKNLLIAQQEKHNRDIQELIPQLKSVTNVTNVTNVTHQTNKLNLNFFLNEQCKDAMSVQNFIQTIQLGLDELNYIRNNGFLPGMMSILTNTLGSMDLYQRPLHCTDLKHETLYIKQGDKWEKDNDEKTELKKLIMAVEDKNYKNIAEWEQKHPTALECDTPENEKYLKLITATIGYEEEQDDEPNMSKLVKHVMREVQVNR